MKTVEYAEILENDKIADDIYSMTLFSPIIAKEAKAGQFVEVYTGLGEYILPRPISISEIDSRNGKLTLVYQTVGKGTEYFSQCPVGDLIKIMGPCGNGFEIKNCAKKHILVGGGIGIPPLVQLCKELKGEVTVFLGAKSSPVLADKFRKLGAEVYIASDDGSIGFKGNVVELMNEIKPDGDMIYSCGPKIMLKFLAKWAEENNIPVQVSMEERMACGIGACVGCVVKIKRKGENDWQNLKVCKDGPVFMGDEVMWDE